MEPHLNGLRVTPIVFEVYTVTACSFMWLYASLDLHAAPVVFEVIWWFYATPCISRLYLKGLHPALHGGSMDL